MNMEHISCEEFYNGPNMEEIRAEILKNRTVFISSNMMIFADVKDGQLRGAIGYRVKAESVEMNNVKVERNGEVEFFELGDKIRWMELEL